MNGLRNDDDVSLVQPPEHDLTHRTVMLLRDFHENGVREEPVMPLRERSPRLMRDAFFREERPGFLHLAPGVRFHLVHGGLHVVMKEEVEKPVIRETRDPDRADAAFFIKPLHRAPRAVHIAVGLMDQPEVQLIEPELLHRGVERAERVVVPVVLRPKLRRHEEVASRNS